jgi:hypothetical protein
MSESPLEQLLGAFDGRDMDAVSALLSPDARILAVDGRRAEGKAATREFVERFLGMLRSTTHRITAEWHVDNVWIAEVEASYVLRDWLEINALPRAFVLRVGPDGIADVRAYGAHEHPLAEHRTGAEGLWIGDKWIPPL